LSNAFSLSYAALFRLCTGMACRFPLDITEYRSPGDARAREGGTFETFRYLDTAR
jgi:hypothetical protein